MHDGLHTAGELSGVTAKSMSENYQGATQEQSRDLQNEKLCMILCIVVKHGSRFGEKD